VRKAQFSRVDMVEGCSTFEYSSEWSFFTVDQEVAAGARQLAHVQESLISGGTLACAGRRSLWWPNGAAVARRRHGLFRYCEHRAGFRLVHRHLISREFLRGESLLPEELSELKS